MVVNQPQITIEQVHARATDKSFQRGQQYAKNGSIFDTAQRGKEIEGFCEGSMPEPYHVRATLNADLIGTTSCTCEYDYGGDCKHIVALLLTYIDQPEVFEEHTPFEDTLASRDTDELIAIIQLMIERYPDLQTLVDRPVPGKQTRHTPLDVSALRKELRHTIRSIKSYDGWEDYSLRKTVRSIEKTAHQFSKQADWQSASAIYRVILEECLKDPDTVALEDDGESIEAVIAVLEGLAECLEHLTDNEIERQGNLTAMVEAFIADVELGGFGLSDGVPDYLTKYTQPVDLPFLRQQINTAKANKKSDGGYGGWGLKAYEKLLMQLDALDNVDPESVLKRLRDEGMFDLLLTKLLEMKRLDEAVKVIEHDITNVNDRLRELPRLSAAGRDDEAVRLGQQTLKKTYDDGMVYWLLERLYVRGDQEAYFQLQLKRFKSTPYLRMEYYIELKQASEALGNWGDVRWDLISWLEKERLYDLLTKIYLQDEEWDHAWTSLSRAEKIGGHWDYMGRGLEFEVAEKSRHANPAKSLPIYIKHMRQQIDQRSRGNYRQAAEYLSVIRELYGQLNDSASWEKLIGEIKSDFKTLPALQDELRKAHL